MGKNLVNIDSQGCPSRNHVQLYVIQRPMAFVTQIILCFYVFFNLHRNKAYDECIVDEKKYGPELIWYFGM